MRIVHIFTDGDYEVKLEQHSDHSFRVSYGGQVSDNLNYIVATKVYGECVFHSLACVGKIEVDEE